MKRKYILATLLSACFAIFSAKAQFTDDFNWASTGDCPSWWTAGGVECIETGENAGCSLPYSGYIPPVTGGGSDLDPVLDLGNQTSDLWYLRFCMYIPSDREAYFHLLGGVPIDNSEEIIGGMAFNEDLLSPGNGVLQYSPLGAVVFVYPENEWFDVEMSFDLTQGMANATWHFSIAGVDVIPAGTAFTNAVGDVPTSLGGINFFTFNFDTEYWIDNIFFGDPLLNVEELTELNFSISPNPVQDRLNIETDTDFDTARIYALDGKLVLERANDPTIDVSNLQAGIYFVEIQQGDKKSVQRLIKE